MANTQCKEVNLTKRVQTSGLRYGPVVLSANGRVGPDMILVNVIPERHSDGAYYLEWREHGRRIRLSVGKEAAEASARRPRKEAALQALNNGVPVYGKTVRIDIAPLRWPWRSSSTRRS